MCAASWIAVKSSKVRKQREPCCRADFDRVQAAEFSRHSTGTFCVNNTGVTQSARVGFGEAAGRRVVSEIVIIVVGASQLVPRCAILGNLHSASLRVAVERIAVDYEVNAVGVLFIICDAIFKLELNEAAERAQRNTSGFRCGLSRKLRAKIAPAGVVGELADGQIAHNRGGRAAGQSVGLGAAGNGVSYTLCDHNNGKSIFFRSCDRVAAVVIRFAFQCRRLRNTIYCHRSRGIDPKRKFTGDLVGTVAASDSAGIAIPCDEHGITGGNADRFRGVEMERIGVKCAERASDIIVNVGGHKCCAIGQRCSVGVGRAGVNVVDTLRRVRYVGTEFGDDKIARHICSRCKCHSQLRAVCGFCRNSQIIVIDRSVRVCARCILDGFIIYAGCSDGGNVAAVSTQGLGCCSRCAERKQRYGHCQHKDQCQRAGIENLPFHA